MMPVIRVSDATWARLKANAVPLEDSVDDVVARALDALDNLANPSVRPTAKSSAVAKRATTGNAVLPQKEFRLPLLRVLVELGGEARVGEIRSHLKPRMESRLSEADYALVKSGEERWWNATCWERNALKDEGLLSDRSPRGVWTLTEAGRRAARA
jgi:hypothetical protein